MAKGAGSHAEGQNTLALGDYSHAEGHHTTASGYNSHAEGDETVASGSNSHAEGSGTVASSRYQHVQGKYNIEDTENKYAHIVGNGKYNSRSNAHTLDWNGNAWFAGDVYIGGTSQDDAINLKHISSNPNLLINSDFRNPVNQRGRIVYDEPGYTIDRWRMVG